MSIEVRKNSQISQDSDYILKPDNEEKVSQIIKDLYKKNLPKLTGAGANYPSLEHDACGVGLVASTEGKKSRKIVEFGIQALKAVWHRGAVDADGKTGDGAGIHIEIPTDFFKERIENYGRQYDGGAICVGMIFLPRI